MPTVRKRKPVTRAKVARRNPPVPKGSTLIYDQILQIKARKGQKHRCDEGCKKADHCYYHNFKPGSRIYGLTDGRIMIVPTS